jgi:hypothetical protein
MNERIREIAKQTGYIWHASGDPQIYEFTPEKLDKFADLVIQECIEQLNISNVPVPISAGLNLGRVAIKEHFGVEE